MQKTNPIKDISVLIVDDNELILHSLSQVLRLRGFTAHTAENGNRALDVLSEKRIDVILADMKMPGMNGLDLLKAVKKEYPEIGVIMITGYGSIKDAVETMTNGATDYIFKPFTTDEAIQKIKNVYKKGKRDETQKQIDITEREPSPPLVLTKTNEMRNLLKEVEIIAPTDATVLITGETGSGKSVIARLIHKKSKRKKQPFIRFNCAEFNERFLETELFGHENGGSTGVESKKMGKLELADKGTFFLDRVGDIAISKQKKLFRVLEQKEFKRVGGSKAINIDVRIIAAMSKEPNNKLKNAKPIISLVCNLNPVLISIPSLRERKEDIIALAEHFLLNFTNSKKEVKLDKKAKDMLLSYSWPGNIRELKSTLERAVLFSQGDDIDINKQLYKENSNEKVDGIFTIECLSITVDDIEKSLLLRVLGNAKWNIQQSARVLNISSCSLTEKIKRYKLNSFKQESFKHLRQ